MKLKKLKLVNFRKHSMTSIEFSDKITFVSGPNGSGKTSILDSISYLLTGRNVRTDKRGSGANDMITFGEGRSLIESEIEDVGNITRTIPHTLQIGDYEGGIKEQQSKLMSELGTDEDRIYSVINSTTFTSMSSKERKDFIFDLMGLRITKSNIRNEFINWCRENRIPDGDIIFDGFLEGETIESQKDIDRIYDKYVKSRRELKGKIKTLKGWISETPKEIKKIDMEDKIRDQIDRIKNKYQKLVEQKANYNARISEMDKKLVLPVVEEDPKPRLLKCLDKLSNINVRIEKLETQIENNNKVLRNIGEFKGKCLLFPVSCSLKDTDIKSLNDSISTDNDNMNKELKELKEQRSKGINVINNLKKLSEDYDNSISLKEKENITKEKETKTKELTSISKDISTMQDDIKGLESELTSILAYNEKAKDTDRKNKEYEKAINDLEKIDIISKAFHPNGIKSIILYKVLGPIKERARERMQVLTRNQFDMDIRLEGDDLNIYLSEDGIERELKHLSSSEVLRVQIVIQDTISHLSGLRFMIVDNVDILDSGNRRNFMNMLDGIKSEYDTIIVLCTGDGAGFTGSDIHNVSLF